MLRKLCNKLCIKTRKVIQQRLRPLIVWLAVWAGVPILPEGFSMFNNDLAKEVGVAQAAIHQKLKGWQEHNQREHKRSHFRQDRWWTYGDPKYWLEKEFTWSSLSTIKRTFTQLEKKGYLLVDRAGGQLWLCALTGEKVNLVSAVTNMQMGLFTVESGASNWPSSIEKHSIPKQATKKRQTAKPRPGIRKDAVADFVIPETRNSADVEIHESHDSEVEGRDILHELPGELVTGWRDKNITIDAFVEQHGIERIRDAWNKAQGYRNRIAGTRDVLDLTPSPSSATPPAPAVAKNAQVGPDDATDPDWTTDPDEVPGNQTPAIDAEPVVSLDANAKTWIIALGQLEAQLDRDTYMRWIKPIAYLREDADEWVFSVPNANAKDMLQHRLYREIRRVLRDVSGEVVDLRFEVANHAKA